MVCNLEIDLKSCTSRVSRFGLHSLGLKDKKNVFWNLNTPELFEEACRRGEGQVTANGAFMALTGEHSGRSPNDRFIVHESLTGDEVFWGEINKAISEENFLRLQKKMQSHLSEKDVFVQDCYCGADFKNRLNIRVVTEHAWHNLFARNMFIQPKLEELEEFEPEFSVLHAPSLLAEPEKDGTNSGTFIIVNLEKKVILIGGTAYAGEIKKSIFSVMNFLMPARGILPMHCSANTSESGDSAIFFGLSGTGKTTLSADSSRTLIGDDEHCWGASGVFNFEGGCYAKTINLTRESEPEIFDLCHTFGSIIENVMMNPMTRKLDFFDKSLTENGRVSYKIDAVPNASQTGWAKHPKNILMLTCDAFGVLPPISKLSSPQAMYHFLSGYTAKVAGTERGLKEPTATFSTCFGAPFMPRDPAVYAKLLGKQMAENNSDCWLVNTGWSGGGVGVGERVPIAYTRAMVNSVLDGSLARSEFHQDPNFGVLVPTFCSDVPKEILSPKETWIDKRAYDDVAQKLTILFDSNFKKFEPSVDEEVRSVAIRADR